MRGVIWSGLLGFCLALIAGCDQSGGVNKQTGVAPAPGAPVEKGGQGGKIKRPGGGGGDS